MKFRDLRADEVDARISTVSEKGTFTDEMRHAIAVAYEKMGVEPM